MPSCNLCRIGGLSFPYERFICADDLGDGSVDILLDAGGKVPVNRNVSAADFYQVFSAGLKDDCVISELLELPDLPEREQIKVERAVDLGFHYLAVDADGKVYVFDGYPSREGGYWSDNITDKTPLFLFRDSDVLEPKSGVYLICDN